MNFKKSIIFIIIFLSIFSLKAYSSKNEYNQLLLSSIQDILNKSYVAAEEKAILLFEKTKNRYEPDEIQYIKSLYLLGVIYYLQEEYINAKPLIDEAIKLISKNKDFINCKDISDPVDSLICVRVIEDNLNIQNINTSKLQFINLKNLSKEKFGKSNPVNAEIYNALAKVYLNIGEIKNAKK